MQGEARRGRAGTFGGDKEIQEGDGDPGDPEARARHHAADVARELGQAGQRARERHLQEKG